MRRADRLFEIVQLIRGRRLSTAAWLARRLEVSERTVYRDVADLQAQGVPIDGEAGVGYRMRAGFDLPPLMFTHDEARALVAAVRIAAPRLDPALAAHGEHALGKILAILPPAVRAAAESLALFTPSIVVAVDQGSRERLGQLRQAIEARRKLRAVYRDAGSIESIRVLRPLGCVNWDSAWTLIAWCESRAAFRNFRIDRFREVVTLEETFRDEPGKTRADFMRQVEAQMAARDGTTAH